MLEITFSTGTKYQLLPNGDLLRKGEDLGLKLIAIYPPESYYLVETYAVITGLPKTTNSIEKGDLIQVAGQTLLRKVRVNKVVTDVIILPD